MSTVIALRGPMGSAKSSFALTLPGKKFIFDLEYGAKRATWRVPADSYTIWQPPVTKEALAASLEFRKGDRVKGKVEIRRAINAKYLEILQDPEYPNIIWDTARELWVIQHQSLLQEKQDDQLAKALAGKPKSVPNEIIEEHLDWRTQLMPIEYAQPNGWMSNIINLAKQPVFNKNLVLINHERDKYALRPDGKGGLTEQPTGEKELDGWNKTLDLADWVLITSSQFIPAVNGAKASTQFKIRVEKSPVGADLVGLELVNPTYDMLMNIVIAQGRSL